MTLVILPVERLTAPREHFRCEPYRCTLTAQSCVERQQQAQHQRRLATERRLFALSKCADCAVGAEVAKRVPVAQRGDLCASCGRVVQGANGRVPLCSPCRKGASQLLGSARGVEARRATLAARDEEGDDE